MDPAEELPENLTRSWIGAGAQLFWLRIEKYGGYKFVIKEQSTSKDMPIFSFSTFPENGLGNLTSPAVPFAMRLRSAEDTDLQGLSRFENLHSLDISFGNVTNTGLKHLVGLKNLHTLNARFTCVTDAGLEHLTELKKLRELDLYSTDLTDAGLKILAFLKVLQSLDLGRTQITDVGLRELHRLKKLKSLQLEMVQITDVGIKELAQLKDLQVLKLFSSLITDKGVKQLVTLKNLEWLSLRCNKISDTSIKELIKLNNLQVLSFSNSEVTNAGVSELTNLPKLASLSLCGTEFTPETLSKLLAITSMQSLYLNGKQLDESVVQRRSRKLQVDWAAAEEMLVSEARLRFPEIAALYPNEEFYGVFFDCDVVYTCVQAHLNTNALLHEEALKCQNPNNSYGSPMYPNLSIEEVIEELRWDAGGWEHFGVFPGPNFEDIAEAYDRLQDDSELMEPFMLMACRAVIRMERDGVFEPLRRTPDFRVMCVYVNETIEEGERRLEHVRQIP